jgi:hypothetical protein
MPDEPVPAVPTPVVSTLDAVGVDVSVVVSVGVVVAVWSVAVAPVSAGALGAASVCAGTVTDAVQVTVVPVEETAVPVKVVSAAMAFEVLVPKTTSVPRSQ